MVAAYFNELKEAGYELSLQGSKQGPLTIDESNVGLRQDLALPALIAAAAAKAGAEDRRLPMSELVNGVESRNTASIKAQLAHELKVIQSQVEPDNQRGTTPNDRLN